MQEVGKIYYYMRDYESSYKYLKKFAEVRKAQNLDIFRHMNAEIGFVFEKMGFKVEAENYIKDYKLHAEIDGSIYKDLEFAMYYSYMGDTKKALDHLNLFSQQKDYHYWTILFVKIDPLMDNIVELPEFKKTWKNIETKFWDNHQKVEALLNDKGLL